MEYLAAFQCTGLYTCLGLLCMPIHMLQMSNNNIKSAEYYSIDICNTLVCQFFHLIHILL